MKGDESLFSPKIKIMNTLDNPDFHKQNNVSPRQIAVKWGLIMGGISIAVSLISYLTGTMDPVSTFSGVQLVWTLLSLLATVYCIHRMQVDHRDQQLGGYLSLGRAVGLGAISGAVSGVLTGIYSAIFFGMVEPDFMKNTMMKAWQEQGMNEEAIETAWKFGQMFTTPTSMLVMGIFMGVIGGVILGLIVGLFTKKDRF